MKHDRSPSALLRSATVLATCGALILVVALCFLAVALWHRSLLSGYGPTYVVVQPASTACFVVGSAIVLVASAFVRHMAKHRSMELAKRRALLGLIGTLAGWIAVGAALLVVG